MRRKIRVTTFTYLNVRISIMDLTLDREQNIIASLDSIIRKIIDEIFVICVTLMRISTCLAHAVNKILKHVEIYLLLRNKSERDKEDKSFNFHLSEH